MFCDEPGEERSDEQKGVGRGGWLAIVLCSILEEHSDSEERGDDI